MPESKSRKKPAATQRPASAAVPRETPSWLVPTMITLLIVGLAWIVLAYLSSFAFPLPAIGQWNIAVGFGFFIAGLGLATRWR